MIEKIVESTIIRHSLVNPGQRVAVAVSGGVDSMVLLHLFWRLQNQFDFKLYALHYEHGIRKEQSIEDMEFVRIICNTLDIPLVIEQGDIVKMAKEKKMNLEEVARNSRYDFFSRCRREYAIDRVAVAHHKDDLVETFMLHLIRGSGPKGLCAMPYMRKDGVIRPLLDVSRQEIEQYAHQYKLRFRQDITNNDMHYSRNFLRLRLMPEMRTLNPKLNDAIARVSHMISEEQNLLEDYTMQEYIQIAHEDGQHIEMDCKKLCQCSQAMRRRLLRLAVFRCAKTLKNVDSVVIERLERMVQRGITGKRFCLSDVFFAQISYDLLILDAKMYTINKIGEVRLQKWKTCLPDGSMLILKKSQMPKHFPNAESLCQYIDADRLSSRCVVRTRQPGDIFSPLGMQGHQNLKKWFIDHKISREMREAQLLLCDGNEVLWIIGRQLSETLRIQANSSNICEIKYIMP